MGIQATDPKTGALLTLADGSPDWGITSLVSKAPWPTVDALVFALPLSFVVAVVVALVTRPMSNAHINACFARARDRE